MKKMKGVATIRLLDKKGNLIYEQEEKNKVTNAVQNIGSNNFVVNGLKENANILARVYTPFYKAWRGCLMFKEQLDDDLIIPNKHAFTMFTGRGCDVEHFDNTNEYDGYIDNNNSTIEKEKLETKFVFEDSACPGDIGCICLTSVSGGNCGLSGGNNSLFVEYTNGALDKDGKCGVGLDVPAASYVPYVSIAKDGIIVGTTKSGNLVVIKEIDTTTIQLKIYKIKEECNFTDTFYEINSVQDYETYYGGVLENTPLFELKFSSEISLSNGYGDIYKATILDDYLYICNLSGGLLYNYKIDIGEKDETRFKVYYQNTSLSISDVCDYRNTEDKAYITTPTYLYIINLNEYRENQYVFENTYTRIETLENNLTPLVFKDTVALLNVSNVQNEEERSIYFLTDTNIFNQNKIVFNGTCDKIVNFTFNFLEPVFGIVTTSGNYCTINANIFIAYLATINNISSVTKYQTTKLEVIYRLTTSNYED